MLTHEKNRLGTANESVIPLIKEHIGYLEKEIEEVRRQIADMINRDPNLKRKKDLLASISAIVKVTIASILDEVDDLGRLTHVREDEPVTQKLIRKILEDKGYLVEMAGDGIEALMNIGKGNYDLILSDVSMPNLDGFKFMEMLNQKGISTPVIFLTMKEDPEDEIKGLELGAADFIKKPINKNLLLTRIGKILNENNKKN